MKQYSEKLFSYGTLQYEAVQIATFGRKLVGVQDAVLGYCLATVAITDPHVIATSGEAVHQILIPSNNKADIVKGMVFEISVQELEQADAYEVAEYKRVAVSLLSGDKAWVYVSKNDNNDVL